MTSLTLNFLFLPTIINCLILVSDISVLLYCKLHHSLLLCHRANGTVKDKLSVWCKKNELEQETATWIPWIEFWTICAALPPSLASWLDDGFDWHFLLPNQVEPSSTWRRTSSQQRQDSGEESPTSSWSWPTADLRTTSTRSLRRCRWQVRDVLLVVWDEALKKVPDCQFQARLACLV